MTLRKIIFINVIAIASISSLTSCKKEGCTDPLASNYNPVATEDDGSCETATPSPSASAPAGYTPSFTGTFAALIGVKSLSTTTTPIGPIDTEIGTAVAVFSNDGGTTYMTAGTVSLDGNNLTANDNNSYTYIPGSSNPTGIAFGSTQNWTGTGSSWTSFSASTSIGFPSVNTISSGNVSTASDYTLSTSTAVSADSILFGVYGPNGTAIKIVAGGDNSYTFSASELSGVGTGNGYAQIVGINYDLQNIGGDDYYLINETVRTKSITID